MPPEGMISDVGGIQRGWEIKFLILILRKMTCLLPFRLTFLAFILTIYQLFIHMKKVGSDECDEAFASIFFLTAVVNISLQLCFLVIIFVTKFS